MGLLLGQMRIKIKIRNCHQRLRKSHSLLKLFLSRKKMMKVKMGKEEKMLDKKIKWKRNLKKKLLFHQLMLLCGTISMLIIGQSLYY
jgi:hypothetical protein